MKDGRMIAWFHPERQEECGCSSRVITVYFGCTHTLSTNSVSLRLAASAPTEIRARRVQFIPLALSGGAFRFNLTLWSWAAGSSTETNRFMWFLFFFTSKDNVFSPVCLCVCCLSAGLCKNPKNDFHITGKMWVTEESIKIWFGSGSFFPKE